MNTILIIATIWLIGGIIAYFITPLRPVRKMLTLVELSEDSNTFAYWWHCVLFVAFIAAIGHLLYRLRCKIYNQEPSYSVSR